MCSPRTLAITGNKRARRLCGAAVVELESIKSFSGSPINPTTPFQFYSPVVWPTTRWAEPKSTWKSRVGQALPSSSLRRGARKWTPTTCPGRSKVIRRCKKFACSTGNFWYGHSCPFCWPSIDTESNWTFLINPIRCAPLRLQMNETYQQPGRWHDVILTPALRKNSEPSEHIMSFHLHGLQPSSVYEAIVQAKNRYGWNEVSAWMSPFPYAFFISSTPPGPALETSPSSLHSSIGLIRLDDHRKWILILTFFVRFKFRLFFFFFSPSHLTLRRWATSSSSTRNEVARSLASKA